MGTVVQLKNQINDSYFQLRDSVENKLVLTEEKIKSKLASDIDLVQKMTDYHIETGGKRLRALLTLGSAKLCGYSKGSRDINLAACVELIHSATLMHDDVLNNFKSTAKDILITSQLRTAFIFNKSIRASNYNIDTINGKTYIFGISMTKDEKKQVINETQNIYGLKEAIPSIILVEDLSRNKN